MSAQNGRRLTYDLEELIPQMMQEIINLKAEKKALMGMIAYMLDRLNMPDKEILPEVYNQIAKHEYERLMQEHPWFGVAKEEGDNGG